MVVTNLPGIEDHDPINIVRKYYGNLDTSILRVPRWNTFTKMSTINLIDFDNVTYQMKRHSNRWLHYSTWTKNYRKAHFSTISQLEAMQLFFLMWLCGHQVSSKNLHFSHWFCMDSNDSGIKFNKFATNRISVITCHINIPTSPFYLYTTQLAIGPKFGENTF